MSKLILPQALLEKFIGQRVRVIMKNNKEFIGFLSGYDEFYRMVMTDVTETVTPCSKEDKPPKNHLDSILLNGGHITMIVPGDKEE